MKKRRASEAQRNVAPYFVNNVFGVSLCLWMTFVQRLTSHRAEALRRLFSSPSFRACKLEQLVKDLWSEITCLSAIAADWCLIFATWPTSSPNLTAKLLTGHKQIGGEAIRSDTTAKQPNRDCIFQRKSRSRTVLCGGFGDACNICCFGKVIPILLCTSTHNHNCIYYSVRVNKIAEQ